MSGFTQLLWKISICLTTLVQLVTSLSVAPEFQSVEWIFDPDNPYPVVDEDSDDTSSTDIYDFGDIYMSDEVQILDPKLQKMFTRYQVHTHARPWFDAVMACWKGGGHLATPGNEAEAGLLGHLLDIVTINTNITNTQMTDAMHVGIQSFGSFGKWLTVQGQSVAFAKWMVYPSSIENSRKFNHRCAGIVGDGRIIPEYCNQRLIYACEYQEKNNNSHNNTSDDGYRAMAGLNRYRLHTSPQTWLKAEATCEREGAVLAVPKPRREVENLVGTLLAEGEFTDDVKERGVYVGVNDLQNEEVWHNVMGEYVSYIRNWASGHPSGGRRNNCAAMQSTGLFIDVPCDEPRSFLCEKKVEVDDAVEYIEVEGMGHYGIHSYPRNWLAAAARCREDNASLAVPRSKEEASAFENLKEREISKNPSRLWRKMYVGIQDIDGDGIWRLIDGVLLTNSGFMEWNTKYSSIHKNNMRCGSLFDGQFVSVACELRLMFICKKSL